MKAKVEHKKVPDDVIIESYNRIGNVWKVGQEVGLSGQQVHHRLCKLGLNNKINKFSEDEIERLKKDYTNYLLDGRLQELADQMNRTKHFICRQAKKLGLTDISRKKKLIKDFHFGKPGWGENGKVHPKGFNGKKHSDSAKKVISEKSVKAWVEIKESGRLGDINKRAMETRFRKGTYVNNRQKCTWKASWREIAGKSIFFRSRWEANYAHYLEACRVSGVIKKWEHEPHLFVFDAIETKYKTYLPDFRVTMADNSIEYHEVKGWFDERSKAKIEYMGLYFPEVCLKIFNGSWFSSKQKRLQNLVPNWEN